MQARYYDPVIGRFYSNDPVGYTTQNPVMSFNRYLYVNNNPYKYTDPNGEYAVPIARASFKVGQSIGNGINVTTKALTGASLSTHIANAVYDAVHNDSAEIEGAVDLVDDLTGQEVVGEIEAGEGTVLDGMGDEQFDPETGTHDKVVKNRTNADGTQTEVHTERNRKTGKVDKVKIKQDGKKSRENNLEQ